MAIRTESLLKKKAGTGAGKGSGGGEGGFGGGNSNAKAEAFGQGIKLVQEGVQGYANYNAAINSTRDLEFKAKQEELVGKQQSLAALIKLNDAQAANMVATYSSGLRAQGSIVRGQTKLSREQATITGLALTNARIKSGVLEREARRVKAEAKYNRDVAPLKIVAGAVIMYFTGGQG